MKTSILLALALSLSACANMGYQSMTPDQIAALARMKDANVNCIIINSPWGRGVTVFVNLDKSVIPSGAVAVDADCKVTLTNNPRAPNP